MMPVMTTPQEVEHREIDSLSITAIAYTRTRPYIFCGKDDGSVHVYDISSEPRSQPLFVQSPGYFITLLHFDSDSGVLTCCDASSTVTSRRIVKKSKTEWEFSDIVLETSFTPPVSQDIASGWHSRLLLSAKEYDSLWKLSSETSEVSCVVNLAGSDKARWVSHATDPGALIRILGNKATIYGWKTLECLATLDLSGTDNMLHSYVIPLHHHHFFASFAKGQPRPGPASRASLQIWEFHNFNADVSSVQPTMDLDWLAPSILDIVGVASNRLVFLNTDYWVCSVDLLPGHLSAQIEERQICSDAARHVIRHFFVPYDWVSLANNLHLDVGKNGEIIFVKRSELVVINRGLEVTDSGVFNPR